jgi:methionyl-tRNA synthetase
MSKSKTTAKNQNQQQNNPVLISVAWPYANGDLHLGHPAGYLLAAGILNDYYRLRGRDVIMVSGTDMHGTPVAVKAWKEGLKPEEFARNQHLRHLAVMHDLGLNYSLYTTTATKIHTQVVQAVFTKLAEAGYIFSEKTEQFWSEKEHKFLLDRYVEGECPFCGFKKARGDQCDNCGHTLTPEELINPYSIFGDAELVKRASTNYYLDLAKLQPLLEQHYKSHPEFAQTWRKHVLATTQAWLKEGLQPRAITRDMEGYGVALPVGYELEREEGKVIYVWFEAVTGYLSAAVELSVRAQKYKPAAKIEFGDLSYDQADEVMLTEIAGQSLDWQHYWLNPVAESYYFMGKDNIPFHAIIWTAMILGLREALGLDFNLPTLISSAQYLNLKGGKFSKSTGNIIDSKEFFATYGSDAARYYLISRMPENKDYDFTWEEFVEANNSELLANLGNFVNRSLVFWNKYFAEKGVDSEASAETKQAVAEAFAKTGEAIAANKFSQALAEVLELGNYANKLFNDKKIWELVKTDETSATKVMADFMYLVANLSRLLQPLLPEFAGKVAGYLKLAELKLAVGEDNWQPVDYSAANLGEITELAPLVKKLELDQVLAANASEDAAS